MKRFATAGGRFCVIELDPPPFVAGSLEDGLTAGAGAGAALESSDFGARVEGDAELPEEGVVSGAGFAALELDTFGPGWLGCGESFSETLVPLSQPARARSITKIKQIGKYGFTILTI